VIYEPKILKNPTQEKVEFMCDGKIYQMAAGEKKPFDGFVAHHALNEVNTGLIEVGAEQKTHQISKSLELDKMSWKELRGIAGSVYKFGMSKKDLLKALKESQSA